MAEIKISQLPAKSANLAATDLLEVSVVSGLSYVSKKITGAELVGNVVPYTGATQDVDLGEYELKAGQIELDQSPTGTAGVAVTRWNNTIGSTETTLKGGSVILKNGVDLVARVVNKVTPNATLTKAAYQVVKVSGAQGQRLAVGYAQANNDNNSADTLGVVIETIPTNQEGFIMTVGQLEGINTTGSLQGESWADGDVLYLSPTTPGAVTKVKPTGSTGHIVIIGYVEYAHVNNGKIYVKIMNGWELDELHNVYINSGTLANNDALIYESSTQLWKNKTIATALGYTPVTSARNITVNGTTANLSTDRTFTVTDANLSTSDVTTNNVSTSKHGFAPKLPNDATKFLDGTGNYSSPASQSGVWGISNASGVYTYYTTLTLAMAAATSGQTIELFADVTDSTSTPVVLKAGVIIQGNGHTYNHTSTTGNTFTTDTVSGTYTFINLNIKRNVTTPTGAYIFANSAVFYLTDTFVFQNSSVEYNYTVSVGNTPFFIGNTYAHTIIIDGLRAISNGSGTMIYDSVLTIRNSYLENTGTGSCYSSYNFTGGAQIENCYAKSNSGSAIFMNYTDSVVRNCTGISSTGVGIGGQSGATVYDSFAFSNTNKAFNGVVAYNCTGQTTTGNTFFQSSGYNCTGKSTTGYTVRPFSGMSKFYNSSFYSSGSVVVYDVDYGASFYNCSIITDYNNAAGHAISIGPSSGNPAFVNNYIQVANTSANCVKGTNSFSAAITGNAYKGATTPVNANVTQTITNTKDNQGNILI